MTEIIPHLYLGGLGCRDEKFLEEKNIFAILEVTDEKSQLPKNKSVRLLSIYVSDRSSSQISEYFELCYLFIDLALSKNINTLVHCTMGRSRSPAILCYYLMKKQRIPWVEALSIIKEKDIFVSPNIGFRRQLEKSQSEVLFSEKCPKVSLMTDLELRIGRPINIVGEILDGETQEETEKRILYSFFDMEYKNKKDWLSKKGDETSLLILDYMTRIHEGSKSDKQQKIDERSI
jgi:dual specificity protein phosphatase 1B